MTIITSSMIMMSGHLWFMVVLMTGRAVYASYIYKCLPVSVGGYCMLHGWVMRSDRQGDITRVTLGSRCDALTD